MQTFPEFFSNKINFLFFLRGPCNGDSGGGFVVKSDGKWYLRGVVSSALYNNELFMCDTHNYAVFTDVAQFKDWIVRYMELHG